MKKIFNSPGVLACMALLALLLVCFSAGDSLAQGKPLDTAGFSTQTETTRCLHTPPSGITADAWENKFTARFVYCMRNILSNATKAFLQKVLDDFALPTLGAVIVFAMTVFGIKLVAGMLRNPKAEAASFLIKIGIIVGIISSGDQIVDFWFDTTDMLLELVNDGTTGIFGSTSYCPVAGGSVGGWYAIWDRFDCLFGQFVGFGQNVASARGMVSIIGALIFTGGMGIWAAFMGFAALYVLAQFLFRSVMLVLLSYGGLALMILLLPLYLPLILFKATENFLFQSWIGFATGFVVQPALTVAFLVFAMTVMDDLMMNGSSNTFIKYDPTTHSTDVRIVPDGQPVPSGYSKAGDSWLSTLGIDPNASLDDQMTATARVVVPGEQGGLPVPVTDPAAQGYLKQMNCGEFGIHDLNTNTILAEAAKTYQAWGLCTDKQKCKQAAQGNLPNAPSETAKLRIKMALCEQGRSKMLSSVQNSRGGKQANYSMSNAELNLNFQNTKTGAIAPGTTPEQDYMADVRMMRLIGSLGTIIILAGTFLTFANTVPGLVNKMTGGPSPKLSLASPTVGGKKLADRLQAGLMRAKGQLKKDSNVLDLVKSKSGKEFAGKMFNRGGLSAVKEFGAGFLSGEKFRS